MICKRTPVYHEDGRDDRLQPYIDTISWTVFQELIRDDIASYSKVSLVVLLRTLSWF